MRVDALAKPGGDLLQVHQYIGAGERMLGRGAAGFTGEVVTDVKADFAGYTLVHLTNLDRPVESWAYYRAARAAGKPVVFSTIHHSQREIAVYERAGRKGLAGLVTGHLSYMQLEAVRSLVRCMRYRQLLRPTLAMLGRGYVGAHRELLTGVDRILVLSEKERRDILEDFGGIEGAEFCCIRNGYIGEAEKSSNPAGERYDLCVAGRVEARKNQRKILEVAEAMGLKAVFVGGENPNHKSYCKSFRRAIEDSRSQYVGARSHAETLELMRRSRVHVSASWFEVLSLVDLEAYGAGCAVVSSECGGTREILGDNAEYINPGDGEDLRRGIDAALGKAGKAHPALKTPDWDEVGAQLLGVYQQVLAQPQSPAEGGGMRDFR